MKPCILALDQGTTSSRAILFDETGAVRGLSQHEYPQFYPHPGWVEQHPFELWSSELAAASDVLRAMPDDLAVCAVSITDQRETTLLWDRKTGRPMSNAIVWQCRRTAGECDRLRGGGVDEVIRRKTGLRIDPYFSATKIAWLLDHVPGARAKAEAGELCFGTVDSWLIWNLTGGQCHRTDHTNASRTLLFDTERLRWDEELCRLFRVPMSLLPETLPSDGIFGTVAPGLPGLEKIQGVPIAGVIGDQQAALFGQTCFGVGDSKNTYGTGCFTLMNTGENRVAPKDGLLSTVAWTVGGVTSYALEGSVFNAGSAIQWLRDELGLISTARECDLLAETVEDTGGVYFVPAFTGLGAPYWDMYARGTITGLTRGTSKAHIARAVLEGIAYQVKDLLDLMSKGAGIALQTLRVDGGASVSDVMMQFQADLLGIPVDRPACVETTAMGSAFLAGLSSGLWDQAALMSLRRSDRVFAPVMEDQRRDRLYKGWQRAVGRTRAHPDRE